MTESAPVVSIILPVYNAAPYLGEAIDSIRVQSFDDWELIAIDDASADNSAAILDGYATADSRIRVFRNETNLGVGGTLDRAILRSRGQFIARMDADDVCTPDRLAVQLTYLRQNPDVIAVGGQIREMQENGETIRIKSFPTDPDEVYAMMFLCVPIQHPALMVNRAALPDGFNWYEGWSVGEDTNLFFKLTQFGALSNVPELILSYRVCDNGNFLRNIRATFRNTYRARCRALREYGYRASVKARLINHVQYLLIHLVPERLAWRLYSFARKFMWRARRADP
tara:strand:- start:2183 stop:3031 length:849 start_codon:yes stop_codon:yes gene_type:complete